MARGGQPSDRLNWPLAKRFYRFVANPRFDHRTLLKGLYGLAQQAVARDPRPYLVVAIDPVNFEKPYTKALEGVSTVLKSTPPGPKGGKLLTPGYPAITATIVTLILRKEAGFQFRETGHDVGTCQRRSRQCVISAA